MKEIIRETIREKLIIAIYDNSPDKLDKNDWFNIAQESESELIDRVINILYKNEYDEK